MALDYNSPEYLTFIRAVGKEQLDEVERHLVEYPELLDLADDYGSGPLHWAAHNGHNFMIELLLQRGSTAIDSVNKYGRTPLHFAAWKGHDSTVKLLLQRGSTSLNFPDSNGRTPLYFALWGGHDSTAKILKAVGASISSFDKLTPEQIEKLQTSIPEEEILEIRSRIYFIRSLTSCLL